MKLIITLILSALALAAQPTTKDIVSAGVAQNQTLEYKLHTSGSTQVGTLAILVDSKAYLTIDDTTKSRNTSMIVRNSSGIPIAFCNIPKGKCWSLPREMPDLAIGGPAEVLEIDNGKKYKVYIQGPGGSRWFWDEPTHVDFGSPTPSQKLHI